MRKFHWRNLCPGGEALHVSYVSRSTGGSWEPHTHDFHEVFWVDAGKGRHLLPDLPGSRPLISGQLCFVRAPDRHGFAAEAAHEPFCCINIAFPDSAWRDLRRRYGLEGHPFLNEEASGPPTLEVPEALHREFSALFHQTLHRDPTPLSRDLFLLTLAERTRGIGRPPAQELVPAWLMRGMMEMEHRPETWQEGSAVLARFCGCSPTHLARVFDAHLGMRPTDWILKLRLKRASRLLTLTGFSVTDIAYESGFGNLSHFHRCFKKEFGRTPLQHRKAVQREAF